MTCSLIPKPLNWVLTITLVASLTGCLGSNSKTEPAETLPNWVTSPPKDNDYLYGVGSSARIENIALAFIQAEQNGNAQIAQQLRTKVSQVNTQDTTVASSGQGDERVSKVQTAYTQVTTAPIELEQAVNEKRFTDTNYVYALQSIDRSRIIAKLQLALSSLDSKIRSQAKRLSTSNSQPPAPDDWRTYMGMIPYFAQRKSYEDDLNLYSTSRALAGEADQDIQTIEQKLGQALLTYGFDSSTTKQSNELASALSSYGLTPSSHSLFTLKSTTNQYSETQSGRFYVFEEGTLELIDPTGSRLASWEVSARGIAKTRQAAKQEATKNWSLQAVRAMFAWLTRLN